MENNDYEEFKSRRLAELAKMTPHKDWKPAPGLAITVGDAVTVKEIPQSEYKTQGGLIIPDATRLQHCKLGIVMNRGELCILPVKEGDTVAFAPHTCLGITHNGVDYLKVPSYDVHFILPPDNYLEPHYADFFEKRREKRIAGEKAVRKREDEKFEEKVELREEANKKADRIVRNAIKFDKFGNKA